MANKSYRKSQLVAFGNAAAGHEGVLSDPDGAVVVKPCQQSEIDFYTEVNQRGTHPDLLPFVPTFMGQVSLGADSTQAVGAIILEAETVAEKHQDSEAKTIPVLEHAWAPSGGGKIDTELAIALQNVAAGFQKPNILDVKLGARLWADDSPQEKRDKLDSVAAETTSKPLGYRIAGMKTWQGADAVHGEGITLDGYKVFDKQYGRNFNVDTIPQAFQEYFLLRPSTPPTTSIKRVIKRFIDHLKQLVEVVENNETRMYSASLLFVFEGDAAALDDAITREAEMIDAWNADKQVENPTVDATKTTLGASDPDSDTSDDSDADQPKFPAICNVKLIDFAHAQFTPGQGPDDNLLRGVRNVIHVLHGLIS